MCTLVVVAFTALFSERIVWIPTRKELEGQNELMKKFHVIYGLSVTEMEILQAAYRLNNPNCEYFFYMCIRRKLF